MFAIPYLRFIQANGDNSPLIARSIEFATQDAKAMAAAIAATHKYTSALRQFLPDSGAYMNEVGIPLAVTLFSRHL